MEFLTALLLLYAVQCWVMLPRGAALLVKPLAVWRVSEQPGWNLLHPLPSAGAYLASRLPLIESEGVLYGRGVTTWRSGVVLASRGPVLPTRSALKKGPSEPEPLVDLDVRGTIVRVNGQPFARALSKSHAGWLADFLREVADSEEAGRRERIAVAIEKSFSLESYRSERERLDRATRPLRVAVNLYFLALFGALPALAVQVHFERALLLAFPAIFALHLSTLAALLLALHRLDLGGTGPVLETLLAAGLFPPLLLRSVHALRVTVLGRFQPAVAAAALMPRDACRRVLRAEVERARAAAAESTSEIAVLEERALLALLEAAGESSASVLQPPTKLDPIAGSYCPVCFTDYRPPSGTCADCGAALAPYPT